MRTVIVMMIDTHVDISGTLQFLHCMKTVKCRGNTSIQYLHFFVQYNNQNNYTFSFDKYNRKHR